MSQGLPHARLISAMPNPLQILWNAWYWSRDPQQMLPMHQGATIPTALSTKLVQHAIQMLQDHVAVTEGIMTMWGLSQIPRSLQEQIVRTRRAAFFAETAGQTDKSHFYDEGAYFPLPPLDHPLLSEVTDTYEFAIKRAQDSYNKLVKLGVPRELARGVLPMHVHSRIMMFINLRELATVIMKRSCHLIQSSYWRYILDCFQKDLAQYFHKWGDEEGQIVKYLFRPPCAFVPICISPKEAENRISGVDPRPTCPLYTGNIRENSIAQANSH